MHFQASAKRYTWWISTDCILWDPNCVRQTYAHAKFKSVIEQIGSSGLFLSHKWLARHVCRFVWCSFHPTKDRYRQYKMYRFVKHSFLPPMVLYRVLPGAVLILQKHTMAHKESIAGCKTYLLNLYIATASAVCVLEWPGRLCIKIPQALLCSSKGPARGVW